MKDIFIGNLKTGDVITSYFMVKTIEIKNGSNGRPYLALLLGDCTGEINGKKWGLADEEVPGLKRIKEGDIVRVKQAQVTEWHGMKQLIIASIRLTGAEDNLEISDFVKAAPEKPEDMYDYILGKANSIADSQLRSLCVKVLEEHKDKLMYYPAAAKNHHAEMAGLLWHVKRMLMLGEKACEVYTNLDKDLLMTGVILHDIEKMTEILSNELGISPGYSFEGKMLGHLVLGVRELEKYCTEMGMDDEKRIMLEHMIISHHYQPDFGSPVRPLFPEAEMLHYLDMIDAKMFDMEEAVNKAEPGDFSDRVWTLDNRMIYHRKG